MAEKAYCNKCGKQMDNCDIYQNFRVRDEMGYGSKYDTCQLDLRLCNKCLDELIDSCKIKPVVEPRDIKPRIILISGHAGCGKDTAAQIMYDYLWEHYEPCKIMHFADLLKYVLSTFYDWNGEKDKAGRDLLQHIGTEVVRSERPTYWADFLLDMILFNRGRWSYVIIPDTRFPNEIKRFVDAGFNVTHVRIERPDSESVLTEKQTQHISETALDDVMPDLTIVNNGSQEDLEDKVTEWMKEELYGRKLL